MRRTPLSGLLTIGIAVALATTLVGAIVLDLSFLTGLLLYSVTGTAATLFAAWRRVKCMSHHEIQPERG